jgi:hypothetical protein
MDDSSEYLRLKELMDKPNGYVSVVAKEAIITIFFGLDQLQALNNSPQNKELVNIIRHNIERLLRQIFV